jgi:transcriptional regulator of arginine metabolism
MSNKKNRILLLRQIIENEEIRSQRDILSRLSNEGIKITQASLSRYLKEMNAVRVSDGAGGYYYKLPASSVKNDMMTSQVNSVEFAGESIAVVKTGAGYANAVSVQIDAKQFPVIAGTVSGDDTILIIIRDGYSRADVKKILIKEFPHLKDKFLNE